MVQRLYVHNFRCLENFELIMKELPSALLIGRNGVGKSTIGSVLEILQNIGRGTNRVGQLVQLKDFSCGRQDVPIRFEIETLLGEKIYKYTIALELPENFKELRILEEQLLCSGESIYSREKAQVSLHSNVQNHATDFLVDWHLVALPIIQEKSETDPLLIFKTWLAQMIILTPIPSLMTGNSSGETLRPDRDSGNVGEWLAGLLSRYPATYTEIVQYLKKVMPDIDDFQNEVNGKNFKSMIVRFDVNTANLRVDFEDLSDGEKCFFLCAIVLAANKAYGPLFCFWDEPDNHLSLSEVGFFIESLRRLFKIDGQILITSHNAETIRKFSNENTIVLDRKTHLEPTLSRLLSDLPVPDDLIEALLCGDIKL